MDFYDDLVVDINAAVGLCATSEEEQDLDAYRDYVAGQALAFIAGIEGDDCDLLLNLEDPSIPPVDVTMEMKGAGLDACGSGGCVLND